MGDRANFGFKANDHTLYLYSHWGGHGMLRRLANALAKVKQYGRMYDPSYATRIAISDIIGTQWDQEYGFGLTVDELCDNEHKVPVVDFYYGTVTLLDFDWDSRYVGDPIFTTTIEEFIERYSDA